MRTERSARSIGIGTNALASSIVLVCRPRPQATSITDRRGFTQALKGKLDHALRDLQSGGIAPVDLAQAAIGPGMAVFSSYAKVVEADGTPMRVRTALSLINQALDEVTAEQEGEFDENTRWAIAWYTEYGMEDGPYGRADDLSRAKNVSVDGLVQAGIVKSGAGKVRLFEREELDPNWDPRTDSRLTVWEVAQHLIHRLLAGGEGSAGELLRESGDLAMLLETSHTGSSKSPKQRSGRRMPDHTTRSQPRGLRSALRHRRSPTARARSSKGSVDHGDQQNRDRVGNALSLLGKAFGPYVDRRMTKRSPMGGNWKAAYSDVNVEEDPSAQIGVILDHWQDAFRDELRATAGATSSEKLATGATNGHITSRSLRTMRIAPSTPSNAYSH